MGSGVKQGSNPELCRDLFDGGERPPARTQSPEPRRSGWGHLPGASRSKIYNEQLDNIVISAKLPLPADGCAIDRDLSVNSNSIEVQEAQ